MNDPIELVAFGDSDGGAWRVVNDTVMGGVSRSVLRRTDRATGIFEGLLSLENSGGFASVRAMVEPHDLSSYDGLELRVRGDGRTYEVRLRTDDDRDGISYRATIETRGGEWITTHIAFDRFQPTYRGRVPSDASKLDTARIHHVAFMLCDKRPGAFALEIDFVRTWSAERTDR